MSEKSIEGSFKMFELPHPNLLDIMKEAYPCAKFYEQQESVPNFKTEIVNCQVCKEADWNPAKGFMPRSYIGATGKLEEVEAILVCISPFEPHRAVEPHRGEEYDPEHSSLEMVEANVRYVHDCIRGLQPRFKSRFHIRMKEFLDKLYPNEHLNQILKKVWITQCRLCSSNSDSTDIDSVSCMDLYLKKQLEILSDATIVVFGEQAQKAMKTFVEKHKINRKIENCYSFSVRPADLQKARECWDQVIEIIKNKQIK